MFIEVRYVPDDSFYWWDLHTWALNLKQNPQKMMQMNINETISFFHLHKICEMQFALVLPKVC